MNYLGYNKFGMDLVLKIVTEYIGKVSFHNIWLFNQSVNFVNRDGW